MNVVHCMYSLSLPGDKLIQSVLCFHSVSSVELDPPETLHWRIDRRWMDNCWRNQYEYTTIYICDHEAYKEHKIK